MKRFIGLLCLLLAPAAWGTTAVTGHLQTLGTGNVTSGAFVRFWLRGCSGNQPTVSGTGLIAPTQGGVFFFDIAADGSGAVTGTLYSTRDSTGLLGGDISCGGSTLAVWYGMQVFVGGKGGPEVPIHAKNGVSLDITQVTPITTTPVVTAPTGDSTYLRLDAGNAPVTGNLTAKQIESIRFADQFTSPQAAIANCPATDCWVMVPGGIYAAPTNMSRSHLHITGYNQGVTAATIAAATNLQWGTPVADGKVVFTSATGTTIAGGANSIADLTIEGVTFDCLGNNVSCLVLSNGVFESHFGTPAAKIVIQNSGTGAGLTLSAGASVGQSINDNEFDVSIFNAGKGTVFTAPSATTSAANNLFHFLHIQNISTRAVEFVQWADSNRFEWTFISGLANAADGITFNTGTPAGNVGVFGNVFEHCLCADATNPGSYTGKLVTVNKAEHPNAILDWEIGPGITSGGGTILSNPTAYPFDAHVTTDITDGNDAVFIGIVGIRDRTNTAQMGTSKKQGSNAGNYTSTSLTFAVVDGTNLTTTLTVPLGWKLEVKATGTVANSTAAAGTAVAIYDGTCGSGTLLQAQHQGATTTADWRGFSMLGVVTGDAAAHTINLCHLTLNAADAVNMENTGGFYPVMTFTLIPST